MPQLKRVACLQEAGIPLMIHAGYPSDANGRDDATMGEHIAVCAFLIAAQEYSYVAVVSAAAPFALSFEASKTRLHRGRAGTGPAPSRRKGPSLS